MEQEAQLIRENQWGELRRQYSRRISTSWHAAWISLRRLAEYDIAKKEFRRALKDPHFEQAAAIVLRKLGEKRLLSNVAKPTTLKLYDAFLNGEPRLLTLYLDQSEDHHRFIPFLLQNVGNSKAAVNEPAIRKITDYKNSHPLSQAYLARVWMQCLQKPAEAHKLFLEFWNQKETQQMYREVHHRLFDQDFEKRLSTAYAQKDGVTIKRLLKAMIAKNEKLANGGLKQALDEVLEIELHQITKNIRSYPFWKSSCLSLEALLALRSKLKGHEQLPVPQFVEGWSRFFDDESDFETIPVELEPSSLCLWQILVEVDENRLPDALLRFPQEERFLSLWSVRNKKFGGVDAERSKQLSRTVRLNLERAFQKSSNKLLWFDRLREVGCTQDFFEYALEEIDIPFQWVLEDLRNKKLEPTQKLRRYLRDRLAVAEPDAKGSKSLSVEDLEFALSFLTPAEMQDVLLARYVLISPPVQIFNDDVLHLFYDAKDRISEQAFQKWIKPAIEYLKSLKPQKYELIHWKWVVEAWKLDPKLLDYFAAATSESELFPWREFAMECLRSNRLELLGKSLAKCKDERVLSENLELLIEESAIGEVFLKLCDKLSMEARKAWLKHRWYHQESQWENSLQQLELCYQEEAVLNERQKLIEVYLKEFQNLNRDLRETHYPKILEFADELRKMGDWNRLRAKGFSEAAVSVERWEDAYQWFSQVWWLSSIEEKYEDLNYFLDLSFRARRVEETQRLLIDYLFLEGKLNQCSLDVLDKLLSSTSVFKLKHLRPQFVDRISKFAPLEQQVLKKRAESDFRAAALYEAFYGPADNLTKPEVEFKQPLFAKKRKPWGLTEKIFSSESVQVLKPLIDETSVPETDKQLHEHEFLVEAKKALHRHLKSFGLKPTGAEILIFDSLRFPISIHFDPYRIYLTDSFAKRLSLQLWNAICCGVAQVIFDRERGLYDKERLVERFFMGLLLAEDCPIDQIVRLVVWLGLASEMIEKTDLEAKPMELMQKLSHLNALLSFYLSSENLQKMRENGLRLKEV